MRKFPETGHLPKRVLLVDCGIAAHKSSPTESPSHIPQTRLNIAAKPPLYPTLSSDVGTPTT
jgi:hypothetical protein